jgi:hypothetical protein
MKISAESSCDENMTIWERDDFPQWHRPQAMLGKDKMKILLLHILSKQKCRNRSFRVPPAELILARDVSVKCRSLLNF